MMPLKVRMDSVTDREKWAARGASVVDRERWAARGASFVAKLKATKMVWFPPDAVEAGRSTTAAAKRTSKRAASKSTSAARKTTKSAAKKSARAPRKRTAAKKA